MSGKKDLTREPSGASYQAGELEGAPTNSGDAVFGQVSEDGPNFKSVRIIDLARISVRVNN